MARRRAVMQNEGRFYTRQGIVVPGAGLREARAQDLLPSVTTVLGVLRKPGLEKWLANNTAETSSTVRDAAAERGKSIHAAIADALTMHMSSGSLVPMHKPDSALVHSGEWEGIVRAVLHFLDERRLRVEAVELSFAADDYAGTADLVCFDKVAEEYVVADFKTGNYIGNDYFSQCAAYAEGLGRAGAQLRVYKIEDGQVMEHRPKMTYDQALAGFMAAKSLYYSALGPGATLRREVTV